MPIIYFITINSKRRKLMERIEHRMRLARAALNLSGLPNV